VTCQEARELFSARVDDALGPEERVTLDGHLAGCAECRRELARFESTVSLLHAVPAAQAPAGFADRVLAATAGGRRADSSWGAWLRGLLGQPVAWGRPIEATVLVLVSVAAVYLYHRTPELRQAARPELTYPAPSQAARSDSPAPAAAPAPAPPAPRVPPSKAAPGLRAKVSKEAEAPPAVAEQERAFEAKREAATESAPPGGRSRIEPPAGTLPDERAAARPPAAPAPPPPPALTTAPAPPAASGPPPAAAPPAPSERPAAARRAPGAPPPASRDAAKDAESAMGAAGTSSAAGIAVAPPDASGRLVVGDRTAVEPALRELLGRLHVTENARRREARALVLELTVPGPAYAELIEGLARLGRWEADRVPSGTPRSLRLTLRLTD
jgi:hypothetical protein